MRVLAVGLLVVAACDHPKPVPPPVASIGSEPVASAPPPKRPPAVVKKDPCPPPAPGNVSEDDTPQLRGGRGKAKTTDWLAARGVARPAAIAWYVGRFHVDRSLADSLFGEIECSTLTVGDASEEALLCAHTLTYSFTQTRALVVVVRAKRPIAVLDVGLALGALDFPEARHLDLALAVDPDGRGAELADRAPEGTTLIEPPSLCRMREARFDQCEAAHAKGEKTEGWCPFVEDGDGGKRLAREVSFGGMGYPATLHDCAAAIPNMRELENGLSGSMKKETHDAVVFVEKACKDRGRYVWKGDRFVRP